MKIRYLKKKIQRLRFLFFIYFFDSNTESQTET